MKRFSLQEYLANPSRKVVTRSGLSVRILCTDAKSTHPIVALVRRLDNEDITCNFKEDGTLLENEENDRDLFFYVAKKEGFVNLYREKEYGAIDLGYFHKTEEEALEEKYEKGEHERIATVKLEWEE